METLCYFGLVNAFRPILQMYILILLGKKEAKMPF